MPEYPIPPSDSTEQRQPSRRHFLRRALRLGTAGLSAPLLLSACGGGDGDDFACTDVSDLPESAVQTRERLEYTDDSPHPDRVCDNCQFWQPAAEGEQCGGCQLFQGPVHPKGYCTSWIATSA